MALEARTAPGKGRGLFAARAYAAGEIVLEELPVVATVSQALKLAYCSVCLRCLPSGKQLAAGRRLLLRYHRRLSSRLMCSCYH